jgi:transposase
MGHARPLAPPPPSPGGPEKGILHPQHAAWGTSRGGLSTTLHLRTDGGGRPLVILAPWPAPRGHAAAGAAGRRSGQRQPAGWTPGRDRPRKRPGKLVGDKGDCIGRARRLVRRRGIARVVPTKSDQRRQPGFDRAALSRLAGAIDGMIGVDPHRDTLAAAATDVVGGLLAQTSVTADAAGYRRLLDFARAQVPGRRCWAVEGAGSYGAGLTAFLQAHRQRVVEVGRPKRPPAAHRGQERWPGRRPRGPGSAGPRPSAGASPAWDREALRVLLATRHSACVAKVSAINQLKALIVGAPEELRTELRGLATKRQITHCARLRDRPARSLEHRMTVRALRSTARRIQVLAAEAAELEAQLERLVAAVAPWLLELPGVGPISAAQVPVSWSHAGRLRSEAAFAALAGVNPIPASSGQVIRHRLNRSGDRQLKRALHTIVLARLRDDPDTRAYAARRRADGKAHGTFGGV